MANNPIQSVTPVDEAHVATGPAVTDFLSPNGYKYSLADISAIGAGRTESLKMNKKRVGQAVTLDLTWPTISIANAAVVLQAFNSEYMLVTYLDALSGTYLSKVFYAGDRESPLYNNELGVWDAISFTIIQRIPDAG